MRSFIGYFKFVPFFLLAKKGLPYFASIDITNACNLTCVHCYYYMKQYQSKQLSEQEWIARIEELKKKHPTIIHCTWVGGEPLLPRSRRLVEKGVNYFKANLIVTNGTYPIPKLKNTVFHVSIDGTEEFHDAIRGKGTYNIAKQNVQDSTARIYLHCVLSQANKHSIQHLVEDWIGTNAKGIAFSFYTPMPHVDDPLFIPDSQRDQLIDQIIGLRDTYGSFITTPSSLLKLFKSDYYRNVIDNDPEHVKNCLLKKGNVISVDSAGNTKHPCVMGKMDCSRCFCVIPYFLHASIIRKDVRSILEFSRTLA